MTIDMELSALHISWFPVQRASKSGEELRFWVQIARIPILVWSFTESVWSLPIAYNLWNSVSSPLKWDNNIPDLIWQVQGLVWVDGRAKLRRSFPIFSLESTVSSYYSAPPSRASSCAPSSQESFQPVSPVFSLVILLCRLLPSASGWMPFSLPEVVCPVGSMEYLKLNLCLRNWSTFSVRMQTSKDSFSFFSHS